MPRRLHPTRWGVRTRSALAAALVVALAMLIAAAALLWLLKSSLESSSDGAASMRAEDISRQLVNDAPTELDSVLLATDGRSTLIQVVDAGGHIVAASPGAPPAPLTPVRPAAGKHRQLGRMDVVGEAGDYRVTARGVAGPGGELTVLVAEGQPDDRDHPVDPRVVVARGHPGAGGGGGRGHLCAGRPFAALGGADSHQGRGDLQRGPVRTGPCPGRPRRDLPARADDERHADPGRGGPRSPAALRGDASHELRSPLATVTAALELARDRPEVLDHSLVAETLLPEAARMRYLVEDLLLLATADERGLALRMGDVDLDDIADAEYRRLRGDPALVVTASIHPVRVLGDAARLSRVVRNLVDNAARFAQHTVELRVTQQDGCGVLVVSDDGPGIPEVERTRVFERFVRLDTDRARSAGGSGLGLAIVAEIVTAHGGRVAVHTSSTGGAEFVLRLPTGTVQQ